MTEKKVPMKELEDPVEDKIDHNSRKGIIKQVMAALAVSLGSLCVGFSSAYTGSALVSMARPESYLEISVSDESWIGSIMPLSALFGGFIGGPLIEFLGRRNTILSTGLPFILAFLLIHFATSAVMVMIGRAFTGLSVGIATLALPVYLGETVEPRIRGTLGLLPTSLGNLGILVAFSAGAFLDWRYLALLGACLPIPFIICTLMIPESPIWHIARGNEEKAQEALQWLRGKDANIATEMRTALKCQKDMDSGNFGQTLKDLFSRKNLRPFFICIGLMFFQQLSGINAIIFYTVAIFRDAGSTIDSNVCSIIVGVVNLGSTLLATLLIDRLGRKILLYISNGLMFLSLGTLAIFSYFKHIGQDMTDFGWVPLPAFVIFIFAFAIGAGPVPWLMMGEILPAKIRGPAASIVTSFNWTSTFLVTKTFIDINARWGPHVPFSGFAIVCLVGVYFTAHFVPETQGKTLQEIEEQLIGKKISLGSIASRTRSVSLAALKPLPSMV